MNFDEVKSRWVWTPIRNCPGRFILLDGKVNLSPEEIVSSDIEFKEFQREGAQDTVLVGEIIDGGLISYRKKDGTYLHTLNTVAGFKRKLTQLGIRL